MSNLGLTFDELIDTLAYGHEIDFSYAGKNYVLMPDINEKNEWEYIVYQVLPPENKPEIKVLYHTPLHRDPSFSEDDVVWWPVGEKTARAMLDVKCIDGKSFMDLIDEIHVDNIN
ncbi:hypothetical protein Dia5BBH33_16640 [Dialister hominis]|uniref:Uncharacterized protein n=2 Tax=Dialister hominis TaxID=2582419 RepID=A0A8D4UVF0_9FIRM|nr:hypothetical protein Dia5BBH33_16640 [Dialister hominis]